MREEVFEELSAEVDGTNGKSISWRLA